jgi:glycosyltransferase involved in cell wall biosynthesis
MSTISVVIPTFNSSETIREAVATARAQMRRPLEIIVVDDGSQDSTLQTLEEIAGPDLIVLRHSHNRGGAAARNTGMAHARGDYVALLDADDLWAPDKLARQLHALRGDPNAFCFCALWQTNEYGEHKCLPKRAPRADEAIADYILKDGHIVQTSTLILPRAWFTRCKFNEGLRRFQDIDFVLQLSRAGAAAVFVDQPLVEWRSIGNPTRVSAHNERTASHLNAFFAAHREHLNPAQQLGLEIRSAGPGPGAINKLRWLRKIMRSVRAGAIASPNALSLMIKHLLGTRSYGFLRSLVANK